MERLEAERAGSQQPAENDTAQIAELAEEVSVLRETTDRLASRLDDALDELHAIRDAEYGALDEKREEQFETAVKSMVAFHQLATEVLDIRVENYEPAAGRADQERVERTRNRIGDALSVGDRSGGGGVTLDAVADESDWPDLEEVARGGRVFGGNDGSADTARDEPETESNAPDSGVYPPIGGGDADSSGDAAATDDSTAEIESAVTESGVYPPLGSDDDSDVDGTTEHEASEADDTDAGGSGVPESGVYPPIGGEATTEEENREEGTTDNGDGSLPESFRPDASTGQITEAATEDDDVVDPIRSTDDAVDSAERPPPLTTDPETTLRVRNAVASVTDATGEQPGGTSKYDDPYPDDEAYARIVDEVPTGDASPEDDRPATRSTDGNRVKVRITDGEGGESSPPDADD